jgi:cob(I)alamin adenosyltransferase
MKLPEITEEHIAAMEFEIDQMDAVLPILQNFILPGGSKEVSSIHIGRCVCRRAERLITQIPDVENISETVLKYINRLSDYLFILARYISKIQEIEEIPWNPNNR